VQRVEVRLGISGYIAKTHFADGAVVSSEAPLFTIDPHPYEIAVEQARAGVVRTHAEVRQATGDFARAEVQWC